MQLALISLVFFYNVIVLGLTTNAGRIGVSKYDFNTPVRVLLDKGQQELGLKSVLNTIFLKEDGASIWKKFSSPLKVQLSRSKKKIKINNVLLDAQSLYVRAGPHHTDPIQVGRNFYRGAVKITLTQSGLLMTNIIPLEEYLQGMVAGEMSPLWEIEALKAQVVAARTYAMYMVTHPRHPLYDLEKGTSDQVYPGAGSESDQVKLAVENTRGQFITKNEEPIKPFYHSRCGGATESAKQVWKVVEKNSPPGVPCPYCQKFPYSWKKVVKTHELFQLLKLPMDKLKPFKIALLNKTATGRVKEVEIESDSQKHLINSDELRHLLGYAEVKSTKFDIKVDNDEIIFEGMGSGHGVGMCQWGAQFLAKQGKTYKQILAHYYPNYRLNYPRDITPQP